jgi:hypothetical protein
MSGDGQWSRNTQHVLTKLQTFAVFEGNMYVSFNVIYHKGMNFTKKKVGYLKLLKFELILVEKF